MVLLRLCCLRVPCAISTFTVELKLMSHHDKSRAGLNPCAKLIHRTIIKGFDLTAFVTDNVVMVMGIIRMRWLIPRIPLGKIDTPCQALCFEEIDKAVCGHEIDRLRLRRSANASICIRMQLNHRLGCRRLRQGCHQSLAWCRNPTSAFLQASQYRFL